MLWIKKVELVDSVYDIKSSCYVKWIHMRNFEVLDAKNASALNRIIHNTQFKRKVSLEEQKEDRFLRGRQIAYLIHEFFRVTGVQDSVENYADLFTISLRNDDIQEFDSRWEGVLLSMTKIPSDDIMEGLYKLRIRESDKLKTVLEFLWPGDSSEERWTWLSQIEDNGEKKYRAECTNQEFWGQKLKLWKERCG